MKKFMFKFINLLIISGFFVWGVSGCENNLPDPLEPDFVGNTAPSIDELVGSWKAVSQIFTSVGNPSLKDTVSIGDTLFIPGATVQIVLNDSTTIIGQLHQIQDVQLSIAADEKYEFFQQTSNIVVDINTDTTLFEFPSTTRFNGTIGFQDNKYILVINEANFLGNPDSLSVLTGVFFVEDFFYDGTTLGLAGFGGQQVFWDFNGDGIPELAETIVNYQKK